MHATLIAKKCIEQGFPTRLLQFGLAHIGRVATRDGRDILITPHIKQSPPTHVPFCACTPLTTIFGCTLVQYEVSKRRQHHTWDLQTQAYFLPDTHATADDSVLLHLLLCAPTWTLRTVGQVPAGATTSVLAMTVYRRLEHSHHRAVSTTTINETTDI